MARASSACDAVDGDGALYPMCYAEGKYADGCPRSNLYADGNTCVVTNYVRESGLGLNSDNKNKSTTHKRKKGQGHVKDPAKIVCFKCKIEGHHVRSCPLKKKPHGEKKQGKRPQDGAHGLPRLEERPLPKKDQAKAPVVEKSSEKKEKRRTCYICREKGHISSFCTSGIDELIPCQLAPSVGSRGDKELISMARSRSSTSSVASNIMDRGKQIETGLVDFIPHPPSRLDAYAYLEEPMKMTFGKFHFHVEKEGSYRLEVPISSGLPVVGLDFSNSVSSVESSDKEISSPRFIGSRASEKLAKIFSDMSFESSADSYISDDSSDTDSFDFIDKSRSIGKVFTNLYDGVTEPSKAKTPKYHQVYAIGEASRDQEETSEAFDDLGNPYVDPSDLRRGLGTKYVGPTPRARVQLPQAAWDRAAKALDGSEPMETTATVEELQAYQYRLARAGRELEKQTAALNRRQLPHQAGDERN
ncbi:hypothetical protein QYE76_038431 [Lolium multiflorum]|uniref:CCHC-type domain-containing protein n=1 Tax=Lolium multiflorum TaxID=4521 RepID=A0AAD8WTL2_LOLMU|nr:hypothetical protein QYE76_038431 [Lolium multiflorum]